MDPASSPEEVGSTREAVTATGITASLSLPAAAGWNYNSAILKVTNNTGATIYNWQVLVSLGPATTITSVFGGEAVLMSPPGSTPSQYTFDPGLQGAPLWPGASAIVTFWGTTSLTNGYASIVSVDGEASGTPGSDWANDRVDHVSRAAASLAVALLVDYENNKLPNTWPPDPSYAVYDGYLLAAHTFVLNATGTGIAFDPNAPGYRFVSQHTQDVLTAAQSNPEVASYLAVGLQSCFAGTNGHGIYTVKAAPFKGLTGGGTGGAWLNTPGGTPGSTDQYQILVAPSAQIGSDLITLSLRNSGSDYNFGAAYNSASNAVMAKFSSVTAVGQKGSLSAACSPFNGPGGGTPNPYFVLSLHANNLSLTTVPALLEAQATQCGGGTCNATLVIDPLAYQTPPAAGSTLGSTTNPFTYDQTSNWALGTYLGAWATFLNPSGVTVLGRFSVAQTVTNPKTHVTSPTGNYLWTACSGQPDPGC
jgi:hypothetical protein